MVKSIEIDCDRTSAKEAEFLQSLVDQSGFFDLPEPIQRVMPDEEQYSISIEAVERSREIHMNKSGIPDDLRPLIRYLAKRAKYEKRK